MNSIRIVAATTGLGLLIAATATGHSDRQQVVTREEVAPLALDARVVVMDAERDLLQAKYKYWRSGASIVMSKAPL